MCFVKYSIFEQQPHQLLYIVIFVSKKGDIIRGSVVTMFSSNKFKLYVLIYVPQKCFLSFG